MEKERNSKLIVIIALVVAVVGLSFGFAAFTKDLNINFSESSAKLTGDLDVRIHAYDISTGTFDFNSKVISRHYLSGEDEGATVGNLVISDDYLSISGGSLNLNNVNQGVMFSVGIYNHSEYPAYLNSVDFLDYLNTDSFKVCTAVGGTDQDLVDQACEGISVNFLINNLEFNDSNFNDVDLSNIVIPSGEGLNFFISIAYELDAVIPNGDFKFNFGGIKFNFSSVASYPSVNDGIKEKTVSLEYGGIVKIKNYDSTTGVLELSISDYSQTDISSSVTFNGEQIPFINLDLYSCSFIADEIGEYKIDVSPIMADGKHLTFHDTVYVSYVE